jgi:hypothetical protein
MAVEGYTNVLRRTQRGGTALITAGQAVSGLLRRYIDLRWICPMAAEGLSLDNVTNLEGPKT